MDNLQFDETRGSFKEFARSQHRVVATDAIDMHKVKRTGNMPSAGKVDGKTLAQSFLDADKWLPYAAEAYNISANMEDMMIVPVTIFFSDLPNSNLAAFSFGELTQWNANAGQIAYKTWKGKPTHIEHANADPSKASGVIFDSVMRPVTEMVGNIYRVVLLAGWDRTRNPEVASKIASGPYGFSMGAWVSDYSCSVCSASLRKGGCNHIHAKGHILQPVVANKLTYRLAHGITGFEVSATATPAFRQAVGRPIG